MKFSRKTERELYRIPNKVQRIFEELVDDLKLNGPYRHDWPNYSPIGNDAYHCHLTYSWVACWKYEKGTFIIEVYYVGSREKAPY